MVCGGLHWAETDNAKHQTSCEQSNELHNIIILYHVFSGKNSER